MNPHHPAEESLLAQYEAIHLHELNRFGMHFTKMVEDHKTLQRECLKLRRQLALKSQSIERANTRKASHTESLDHKIIRLCMFLQDHDVPLSLFDQVGKLLRKNVVSKSGRTSSTTHEPPF